MLFLELSRYVFTVQSVLFVEFTKKLFCLYLKSKSHFYKIMKVKIDMNWSKKYGKEKDMVKRQNCAWRARAAGA